MRVRFPPPVSIQYKGVATRCTRLLGRDRTPAVPLLSHFGSSPPLPERKSGSNLRHKPEPAPVSPVPSNVARLMLVSLLWAMLLALCPASDYLTGKVVGIADGDTITILTADKEQVKIRLHGIDSPERGQEYSAKAKQALAAKIAGEIVTVEDKGSDRYRRTVGVVNLGRENVNLWLVREGWAFS